MKLKIKLTRVLSGFVISLFSLTLSAQGIDASLYTFDFLPAGSFPIENRAAHLTRLGFKGVTFRIGKQEDIDKLKAYLSTTELKSGTLSIPVVFFSISLQADGSWNQLWKQSLELSPSTSLWAIIKNTEHATEEKVVSVLKEMCVEAQKSGTDVVIYPCVPSAKSGLI